MELRDLQDAERVLRERCRLLRAGTPRPGAHFVLYWMTTALRAEENPALERALIAAHKLSLPLVVYHGLSYRYAYASDRIHRFILEGEPELRRSIEGRGARYVFFLERPGPVPSPLLDLSSQAALVVVDDFPTFDVRRWTERFVARTESPVLAVDAACVVPMRQLKFPHERAFLYRKEVEPLWAERLAPVPRLPATRPLERDLGESAGDEGMDLSSLHEVLAALPIDHAVAPAPALRGGATAASERWARFLTQGLDTYAERRNDALDDAGVSGMSPYLHFGMVWAGRLAREARARGGAGATKWLEELLVWRELSYSFCFQRRDHDSVSALPPWAREDLEARPGPFHSPSLLALDRGETGDALWDAAQQRLRRDGWLHNNVRMTWGKQVVAWVRSPALALRILCDLNHRYALDGRDPSSYGGILWALGGFDHPHEPTVSMGRVRSRPTSIHARRLPPARYGAAAVTPAVDGPEVIVVGAGLAGIACARILVDAGASVTVLEKSPALGGRVCSRAFADGLFFEEGTPFLRAETLPFKKVLEELESEGPLTRGTEFQASTWVGVHGLRAALVRYCRGITFAFDSPVRQVEKEGAGFKVHVTGQPDRRTPILVLAIPAPQAAALLADLEDCQVLRTSLESLRYRRCIVISQATEPQAHEHEPAADSIVARVGIEQSGERAVRILELTTAESERLWDLPDDALLREVAHVLMPVLPPSDIRVKRWRFARCPEQRTPPFFHLGHHPRLLVVGDAFGGTAEAAFNSGASAASLVLNARLDARPERPPAPEL